MSKSFSLARSITTFMKMEALPASVLLLASVLACNSANATNLYSNFSTSTTIDGGSNALNGSLRDVGEALPWTVELYANVGDCLRVAVSTGEFAATLVVVAPTGTVYRDASTGFMPKVKVASAPVAGWYTVQVTQQQGLPQVGNFTVLYGRYNSGNTNCASPTSPL